MYSLNTSTLKPECKCKTANKPECMCKSGFKPNLVKIPKNVGLLNPAFEDFDLSEIHFDVNNSSPTTYFRLDSVNDNENRLNQQTIANNHSCSLSSIEPYIDVDRMGSTDSLTITPIKRTDRRKRSGNKYRNYSVWFIIWFIIVISFAGILASVATIIWLETYNEVNTTSISPDLTSTENIRNNY